VFRDEAERIRLLTLEKAEELVKQREARLKAAEAVTSISSIGNLPVFRARKCLPKRRKNPHELRLDTILKRHQQR
jgi:hypothetical protein